MDISRYISGGYVITKYVDGTEHNRWLRAAENATEDLLPDKLLSVGLCGAPFAPPLSWVMAQEDCEQFGVPEHLRGELESWADEKDGRETGYPNIFFSLATAREYVQRFTSAPDIQILGIGVHEDDLPTVEQAEQAHPRRVSETGAVRSGFSDIGFAQALAMRTPCAPGEILGFDVICLDYGIDHSWHCNGLSVIALSLFNFRPNRYGLIDDKADADKLVRWIEESEVKPEPGFWLPVLVTRYALQP
jgi:hypothetical protein